MNNGRGLKRQMCKSVNMWQLGMSNMDLRHGFTRMADGTTDALLLLQSVISKIWVAGVEIVQPCIQVCASTQCFGVLFFLWK